MTLNVNNKVELNGAIGECTSKLRKPVICIETGEVFASCKDAAQTMEVHWTHMSACCLGKVRSVKGKHFCYVSKTSENLDVLTTFIRTQNARMAQLEADAAIGRAIREEQEAKQKAEEQRLKTIEDAKQAVAKANETLERRKRMMERKENDYMVAISRYTKAEKELHEAELYLLKLEGKVTETEEEKE